MRRLATLTLLCCLLSASAASAADTGSTVLVSRPDGTGPVPPALANDSATPGALSADGRYAAFVSDADGLAPGADPALANLFLRDRQAKTTTLVGRSDGFDGVAANARARNPDITITAANGHVLVAFESAATNLVDQETGVLITNPQHVTEIWVRDVTAGTTTLVSRATGTNGAPANAAAANPAITDSAGGALVAFDSQATNLVGTGVFVRTLGAHFTAQVSCPLRDCATVRPSLSSNPDITVVQPQAGTICAPPVYTVPCMLIAFQTGDTTIFNSPSGQIAVGVAVAPFAVGLHPLSIDNYFSVSSTPTALLGNATSTDPVFSGDGQAIAFISLASNLIANGPSGTRQAYEHQLPAGATTLVSRAPNGDPANGDIRALALGGTVAGGLDAVFQTGATNLGGTGGQTYRRNLTFGTTTLLNRTAGPAGTAGEAPSLAPPAISGDGSTALFETRSSNLGDGARGRFDEVHARSLATMEQKVELVSRTSGADPVAPSGTDDSFFDASHTVVSANGRYVAFASRSLSLSEMAPTATNVFVRDTATNQTVLVSRATGADGAVGNGFSNVAGISADGRKVAFTSSAANLSPDAPGDTDQAYVRDLDAGTTTLVSRTPAGTPAPRGAEAGGISADGTAVVMTSRSPLDPAGADDLAHVYVRDLGAQTTTLADRDDGAQGAVSTSPGDEPTINADGTRVAWVTVARLADAPDLPKARIYLRDLRTHETTFISRATGAQGIAADGPSSQPAIDAAGDVVAFASASPNLGTGADLTQVFVRDVKNGKTELVSRPVGGGALLPAEATNPTIDAGGNRITFLAFGAVETPPTSLFGAYVRDRAAETTTLVSRADGVDGAGADHDVGAASISASGGCVAFSGTFDNLGDGFGSFDFSSVHLRAVSGTCPAADPVPPVDAPAGPGGGGDPGGGGTTKPGDGHTTTTPKPPVLSSLKLSPSRFRSGRKTAIVFTLSSAARVTVKFERLTSGHRKGRRCVAHGPGKPCTIVTQAGTLTVSGRAGANTIKFSGKLKGRALRAGRYRLTATPLLGKPHSAKFAVLAARRSGGSR